MTTGRGSMGQFLRGWYPILSASAHRLTGPDANSHRSCTCDGARRSSPVLLTETPHGGGGSGWGRLVTLGDGGQS